MKIWRGPRYNCWVHRLTYVLLPSSSRLVVGVLVIRADCDRILSYSGICHPAIPPPDLAVFRAGDGTAGTRSAGKFGCWGRLRMVRLAAMAIRQSSPENRSVGDAGAGCLFRGHVAAELFRMDVPSRRQRAIRKRSSQQTRESRDDSRNPLLR